MAQQAMTLTAVYPDGTRLITHTKPKYYVALERQFGVGVGALGDAANQRFEHMCYLAWIGLHLTGQEPDGFDDFLTKIDDIEVEKSEEAPPLVPAASPAQSPDSPPPLESPQA